MLVVSGLHLSAVGGLVYAAVRRMGRRRLACACAKMCIRDRIRAPRHEWQRIDLTFAAAGQSAFVGDGKGYADKEVY